MKKQQQLGVFWLLILSAGAQTNGFWNNVGNGAAGDLIPEWLPGCFDDSTSSTGLNGVFTCLSQNVQGSCLSGEAFVTVGQCVSDALDVNLLDPSVLFNATVIAEVMSSLKNISRDCLDPLVDCVKETIQERIATVLEPTCLPGTLKNLTQCAQDNGASCLNSCQAAWDNTITTTMNPWEGLDESSVATCSGIQTEVVDPSCAVVTCGEPCVPAYEELMDCLVNDVLNYTGEECDFQCAAPSTRHHRHLRSEQPKVSLTKSSVRFLDDGSSPSNIDDCLQFAPGLTGATPAELASRSQYFMSCVANQFATGITTALGNETSGGGEGSSGNHTSGGTGDDDDDDDDDGDSGSGSDNGDNGSESGGSHGHGRPDWEHWTGGGDDHNHAGGLVTGWLPGCFNGDHDSAFSFMGLYACLKDNAESTCFSEGAFQNLSTCVTTTLGDTFFNSSISSFSLEDLTSFNGGGEQSMKDIMQAFNNATQACLSPFAECINATIQDRIDSLLKPTCLPGNLSAVEQCARDNADTCNSTCTTAWSDHSTTLETILGGINSSALDTCSGIQSEIMDPSCQIVTCCEPCVKTYETLMECVANEVLNITEEACDFTCAAAATSGTRHLLREYKENKDYAVVAHQSHRALDATTNSTLSDCLQYAPGLTGSDAQELASRSPYFVTCINAGMVTVIQDQSLIITSDANNTNNTGNNGSFAVTAMPSFWIQMALVSGSIWVTLFL